MCLSESRVGQYRTMVWRQFKLELKAVRSGQESFCVIKTTMNPFDLFSLTRTIDDAKKPEADESCRWPNNQGCDDRTRNCFGSVRRSIEHEDQDCRCCGGITGEQSDIR